MASIANDPGRRRPILFVNKHGDRKALWLGKLSKRLAEEIKTRVESILAEAGLVTPRAPMATTQTIRFDEFLGSYNAGRSDVKPRTRINLKACKARLVEFFGEDKPLASITA